MSAYFFIHIQAILYIIRGLAFCGVKIICGFSQEKRNAKRLKRRKNSKRRFEGCSREQKRKRLKIVGAK